MAETKKDLTEKQEAFLEFLCGEAKGNIRSAMSLAGMRLLKGHLCY